MTKDGLVKEAEKYVKQNYCEMCVMADYFEKHCKFSYEWEIKEK